MLISIIMPYNKGIHFLSDAISSIANSVKLVSKKDVAYELIIVADSSCVMDEVNELVLGYVSMDRLAINVITTDITENVAALRNRGLEVSKGEYIYFFDSDDYIAPETIERIGEVASKGNYDLVLGKINTGLFKYDTFLSEYKKSVLNYNEKCDEKKCVDICGLNKCNDSGADNMCDNMLTDIINTLSEFNLTVLNTLIKREYLSSFNSEDGLLHFDEENRLYSDMSFVAHIYSGTDKIAFNDNIIYIKRIHNDSIRYPSLDQLKASDRKAKLEKAYSQAINIEKTYDKKSDICIIKKAIQLREKNIKKNKHSKAIKRIGNFFKKPTFLYRMIEKVLFRPMSMKDNYIVFESFLGKNYSDSCKYIYEYIIDNMPGRYKCIWVVNDKKTGIPGNPVKVKYLGIKWFYYTSRAKYYVSNMRQPLWLYRRPGSVMLETWHGTPLKKLVFDMEDIHAATPTYKMDMYAQSRKWDYLISDNPFSTDVFESCFLYPREKIIETGYPRNDILYCKDMSARIESIKSRLGIEDGKKVILYAPTWRDDEYYRPGEYQFALKLNLDKMKQQLGDEYVILLRTHYFIADAIDTSAYEGFAYNVCRYDDIAELYLISDICITDYSSVFFDYANLRRPILFYVYDYDKYRDKLRGFYIDMETELPGPLLYTEEEVYDAVKNIGSIEEKYRDRYEEFYNRFCALDDGNASKRVVEKVFDM